MSSKHMTKHKKEQPSPGLGWQIYKILNPDKNRSKLNQHGNVTFCAAAILNQLCQVHNLNDPKVGLLHKAGRGATYVF